MNRTQISEPCYICRHVDIFVPLDFTRAFLHFALILSSYSKMFPNSDVYRGYLFGTSSLLLQPCAYLVCTILQLSNTVTSSP